MGIALRSILSRARPWCLAGGIPLVMVILLWPRLAGLSVGPADPSWRIPHRQRLLTGSLLRYYVPDGRNPAEACRNLAAWLDPLRCGAASDRRPPRRAAGPCFQQFAVQLDDQPLQAPVARLEQCFTVEFLIRHHGQGFVVGGNSAHTGSLISMGDGVYSGFVFWLDFPANRLTLQLGQPKPTPAVAVSAMQRIPQSVWTHIAGTWDQGVLSLYVNGLLCGRTKSDLKFHEVARSSRLRAGYVGNGMGAARFDLQYLAVYRAVPDPPDILALAGINDTGVREISELLQAGELLTAGYPGRALAVLQSDIHPTATGNLRSLLAYRRAECLRELRQYDAAEAAFAELAELQPGSTLSETALYERTALQSGVRQPSIAVPQELAAALPASDAPGQLQYSESVNRFLLQIEHGRAVEWREHYDSRIAQLLRRSCWNCHADRPIHGLLPGQLMDGADAAFAGIDCWQAVSDALDSTTQPAAHATVSEYDRLELQDWIARLPAAGLAEVFSEDADFTRYFDEGWHMGGGYGRRLTRAELRNAIRDLLSVTLSDDQLPPPDGSGGEGFDTNSSTLLLSASWLDRWLQTVQQACSVATVRQTQETADNNSGLLPAWKQMADAGSVQSAAAAFAVDLQRFARRAWRRPLTDSELQRLLQHFQDCRTEMSLADAVAETLAAVLLSPHFLMVLEPEPPQPGRYRLNPYQYAARLALFLWSSVPDDTLLDAATAGELSSRQGVLRQVRRMLADDRSAALGWQFGIQWLGLEQLQSQRPDPQLFPEYSSEIAALLHEQAARTVWNVLAADRPLMELLAAETAFVNPQLARWYGITVPTQADWQQVSPGQARQGGVLTLGAVHVLTSYPRRTSPVLRGRWLLETLLGETVQPPPPGVPVLQESSAEHGSLREQLEQHRADPNCIGCHQLMDPLGFALEQYDAVGRLRQQDGVFPVDANAVLPDGTQINGVRGLVSVLQQPQRQQQFLRLFSRRLLGYALGRELDRFDDPVIEQCLHQLRQNELRSAVLIEEIAVSVPFRSRYAIGDGKTLLKQSAL